MKITDKKLKELMVWEYFIPDNCKWAKKTNQDVEKFFEWSEQGKHKDLLAIPTHLPEGRTYFHALFWGKTWAGRHWEMYEQGVLDGIMPYFTLIGGLGNNKRWWQFWKSKHKPIPRPVVDQMKKEMFKGIDAEIIENCYQQICHD